MIQLLTTTWQSLVANAIDDLPPDIAAAVGIRIDSANQVTITLTMPIPDGAGEPTEETETLTVATISFDAAAGGCVTLDSPWVGSAEFSAARGELWEVGRRVQCAICELAYKVTAVWATPPIVKQFGRYLRSDGSLVLRWQAPPVIEAFDEEEELDDEEDQDDDYFEEEDDEWDDEWMDDDDLDEEEGDDESE